MTAPADESPPPSIEALRGQDARAFEWLIETTRPTVIGVGRALGLRGADLDDATAEAYLAVWRALPGFQGRSAVATWVYAIAVRGMRRQRQRRSRHPTAALIDEPPAPAEATAETHDRDRAVWAAVSELGEPSALAVELFYRRGMPVDQVAAALACPAGTVKTLLFRARATLREALKEWETP